MAPSGGARGERKSRSDREQFVLNEAFDFPALENPMLSGRQTRGGAFSSICSSACDTKANRHPVLLVAAQSFENRRNSRTNWKLDSLSLL